jgi:hypothetical protein
MHLSFISYDREAENQDHHAKLQDESNENRKKIGNWLDSYEVTANGFLRPRIDPDALGTDDSPQVKTSSFSAIGNAAATPGKAKAAQERQLISGREFRDILEACRPRISGITISSSLASILKLQQTDSTKKANSEISISNRPSADKIMPLREWGTVDFSEFVMQPKAKSIRSESPSSRRSILLESLQDKSDGDSCSDSGSFVSHVSHISSVLGMGYDRVLWDQFSMSSSVGAKQVQLQRSLSFDFRRMASSLKRRDSNAALTGDSVSYSSSNASLGKLSSGGEAESIVGDDTSSSILSGQEKHIDSLRKLMDAHDANICARFGSQDDQVREINIIPSRQNELELSVSSKGGGVPQSL